MIDIIEESAYKLPEASCATRWFGADKRPTTKVMSAETDFTS